MGGWFISGSKKASRLRKTGEDQHNKGTSAKAFRSFLAAAKLGDEEAQVTVGYDYAYGITRRPNIEKALRWWEKAHQQGSWAAAIHLGMYFRDARRWAKALAWFERAVSAGDHDGLIEIAEIHLRHGGDRPLGLHYLERSIAAQEMLTEPAKLATEGLRQVQAALTSSDLLYMEAYLFDEQAQYKEALPLLLKGAGEGGSSCQLLLGNYLSDGRKGVAKNLAQAVHWYRQAYEQGCSGGAFNLAMHYRKRGEIDEAYRWFELAAESADLEAHLSLAKIWLHDRKDRGKAIEHLEAMFQGEVESLSGWGRDEARAMLRRLMTEDD